MSNLDPQFYSRSALAEKLDMTLKELTQLMLKGGWISEATNGLELTAKGEFEGGKYRESNKYGKYIVWPESVLEHALLRGVTESTVTVSQLLKGTNLPPRLFNRLLTELGWMSPFSKGWKLTDLGKKQKGEQYENDSSGLPYVKWPRDLLTNPTVKHALELMLVSDNTSPKVSSDLAQFKTLNGLLVDNIGQVKIANWLYLLGFNASYQREFLSGDQKPITPDFYLPDYSVVIEYWDESLQASELSDNLSKQAFYSAIELKIIEINHQQLEDLDQVLSKELLHLGVSVY